MVQPSSQFAPATAGSPLTPANMQAIETNRTRAALEPMRKAMCSSLGVMHMQFASELNDMYMNLIHAQMNLCEVQRQYAALQEECSQVRM